MEKTIMEEAFCVKVQDKQMNNRGKKQFKGKKKEREERG